MDKQNNDLSLKCSVRIRLDRYLNEEPEAYIIMYSIQFCLNCNIYIIFHVNVNNIMKKLFS